MFRIYCFIAMACCHCLRNASRLDWSKKNEASTSGPTGIGLALARSLVVDPGIDECDLPDVAHGLQVPGQVRAAHRGTHPPAIACQRFNRMATNKA